VSASDEAITIRLTGRRKFASRSLQLIFFVLILALWYGVTATGLVSGFFLPRPERVFQTFVNIIASGEAWPEFRITVLEFVIACPIAAILGTIAGYAVSRTVYRVRVYEPIFAGLYAIPIIVFYPISVLCFGIGPESKIAHGALFGFFPIALNTIQGFSRVDPVLLRLAASMGASPAKLLVRIMIPAALPTVLNGYRLGFMLIFLAIIGGETIASLGGLGHRIVWYAEGMETVKMFAYILLVIIIVVIMNALLSFIETRREAG
jgi:ABC-type nitrate/sulfonate/bicarbonate transport system permease component